MCDAELVPALPEQADLYLKTKESNIRLSEVGHFWKDGKKYEMQIYIPGYQEADCILYNLIRRDKKEKAWIGSVSEERYKKILSRYKGSHDSCTSVAQISPVNSPVKPLKKETKHDSDELKSVATCLFPPPSNLPPSPSSLPIPSFSASLLPQAPVENLLLDQFSYLSDDRDLLMSDYALSDNPTSLQSYNMWSSGFNFKKN